jgi:hypothetical protein
MSVNLSALAGAGAQFLDANGNPLTGGKLYSYEAGTTTPQVTYTTALGDVPHANPIILDSAGRVPGGQIWLTDGLNYKFVLTSSTDTLIGTWDNITGIDGTGIATNASNVEYDPAGAGAVATTVQTKLREIVSVKDYGAVCDGVTNDANALILALSTGKKVFIPANTHLQLDAAQAAVMLAGINQISPEENTVFNLSAGQINMSTSVNINNPDAIKIQIIGDIKPVSSVTAVTQIGGAAKNHSVRYSLLSAADIDVDDYVIISGATGTGNFRVVEGCFKVISKTGNDIVVKHTMNAAWPSSDFTFTSASCWPIKTVIRWPINSAGIRIGGCTLAQLTSVVLAGSFDITTQPPSDSAGDGLQVGTAPDTFVTSLNESEQINAGAVWVSRAGFVEWQGNGLQVSGGNFYGTLVSACSNGWRGFQAARAGSAEVKFSSAVGNGASGYQAEAQGWLNASQSVANGNIQQGYYTIGSGTVLADRTQAIYNQTGVDARYNSAVLADQALISHNTFYGVYTISGYILFRSNATTNNNGVQDVVVVNGGTVNASNSASLGSNISVDFDSGSKLIKSNDKLLYSNTSFLENSTGGKSRWAITSIADVVLGFDPSNSGTFSDKLTFKSFDGAIYPNNDGVPDFGRAANRWSTIFAVTGAINTSDANEKQDIAELDAAEKRVAVAIKGLIKKFRFKSAVEKKGDDARIHVGVIAQDVKAVFEAEGLDANRYGLFCSDTWTDDNDVEHTRLGVRYEELLAFVVSAL